MYEVNKLLLRGIILEDEKRFVKEWEEKRKKGKLKYILSCTFKYFIMLLLCFPIVAFLAVIYISIHTGTNFQTNAPDIFNIQIMKRSIPNISGCLTGFTINFCVEWYSNEQ
jgi:hypothetical protein